MEIKATPLNPALNRPERSGAPSLLPALGPSGDLTLSVSEANASQAVGQNLVTPLAQGQSLTAIPLVQEIKVASTVAPASLKAVPPRAIEAAEMDQVLGAYNTLVRARLDQARPGTPLDKFETSLRLMASLGDSRLQQDTQAWEVLQMRRAQIEAQYQNLTQSPEIKQVFASARTEALRQVFGQDLQPRAQAQAAWLLSDDFQQQLDALKGPEIQARVQQELSNLAALNPKLAEQVAGELFEKTLSRQAIKSLQSAGAEGDAARAGLGQALSVYLKAQQSAAGIGMQATNLARLSSLGDEKLAELGQAVADLAQGSGAVTQDAQKLANTLLDRVDDLPLEMRQDASALISHLHAQNILGTVLLAGSVAGLLNRELPQDPKAWVGLTTASLGTASMSHFAFRLVGLNQAADLAGKLNFKAALGGLQIPVLGSVLTGINTTLDAMAFVDELYNEDSVGATSRALGVGSGLATLAAITLMSGPAAPVTLIGATVVGVTAWGIDSVWGESDLTGRIRQQLRQTGISEQEQALLATATSGKSPGSNPERAALIAALMDQATDSAEESQIHQILMQTPDQDFLPLLAQLHLPRLCAELENTTQVVDLLKRSTELAAAEGKPPAPVLAPMLSSLAEARRGEALSNFVRQAAPEQLSGLSTEQLQHMVQDLSAGWHKSSTQKQAIVDLLSHPGLRQQSQVLLSDPETLPRLSQLLPGKDTAVLLSRMLQDRAFDATLNQLYRPLPDVPPATPYAMYHPQLMPSTRLGNDVFAARLSYEALKDLPAEQINALPPQLRAQLHQLLSGSAWRHQAEARQLLEALK
ncbi:MAG: hypothetical protein CVV27_03440 [Candidatus Melainabacteria bacterium HGW-Melainabacteria-1]|nr:MAG: hypothetical protein CVV27_03440 [Candidatus Melainabacteria bacterium HGW-Melainabacteria-1]